MKKIKLRPGTWKVIMKNYKKDGKKVSEYYADWSEIAPKVRRGYFTGTLPDIP